MNVRLRHDLQFTAGIYYNGAMAMNNYSLRLWLTTASTEPSDHNTAFERIKYFIYHHLDSSIFINEEYKEQCQKYFNAEITLVTIPGEPVDQLIGLMLYHKLNAITEGRMIVEETEIASSHGENVVYLHSEHEKISTLDIPDWWVSSEPISCNLEHLMPDNIVTMPHVSHWRELDLAWENESTENTDLDNTLPGKVLFADFKRDDDTK